MNEEINPNTEPATEVMSASRRMKLNKSNFWKFLIPFAAIILLVLVGYWGWNERLSR